jgi:2,4-dienoyl-CoA reductase-like NADH-dependent reductase (Old Yellow Enzyme family)
MKHKYPNVFRPIDLGPVQIATRFYFAPHGSSLSVGTKPSDDLVAYSVERVKGGGCGLVIVALAVHERGRTRQPCPHPPENVAAFRILADAIHAAGGKIFGQLLYWWGGYGQWQPLSPPAPSLAPSVRQFGYSNRTVSTHAMDASEIEALLQANRQSARHLRQAGFDGVMLHSSHAGLVEQFLSPYFNERNDEFGGSLKKRMRFLQQSLRALREGLGNDKAVGIRFNCDEQLPGGYGQDVARTVIETICNEKLVDYVELDVGVEPQQFHHGMPTVFADKLYYQPFVKAVRAAAGKVPVLSVLGRITTMAEAETAIATGICDMTGAARQLIAEPEFVKNAREGREDRSRTCIACNYCTAAVGDGAQGCLINPASYRERLWGTDSFKRATQRAKVVVVGGGSAGLEAARVAALKGHEVSLFEARARLGGGLALWALLPGREFFGKGLDWWNAEIARLGVRVRLNTNCTAMDVLAEKPDAVIVATGAQYSRGGRSITFDADLPGSELPFVYRPEDILMKGVRPTGNVLLADGEGIHVGLGIAELLANGGAKVTYASAEFSPLSPRVVDAFEGRALMQRLKRAGVQFQPTTWVRCITERATVLYDVHTQEERQVSTDAVVLCTGREPISRLAAELSGKVKQLFLIGDALAARPMAAATYEAQKFARLIGEPGAPSDFSEAYFLPDSPEVWPFPADMPRR